MKYISASSEGFWSGTIVACGRTPQGQRRYARISQGEAKLHLYLRSVREGWRFILLSMSIISSSSRGSRRGWRISFGSHWREPVNPIHPKERIRDHKNLVCSYSINSKMEARILNFSLWNMVIQSKDKQTSLNLSLICWLIREWTCCNINKLSKIKSL